LDGDQPEPVAAGFDRAYRRGSDADNVPLPQLVELVVEADPAGAVDDDVGLFLFAVAVCHRGADAGRVAEVADPEMLGVEVFAREATFDPGCALACCSSVCSKWCSAASRS